MSSIISDRPTTLTAYHNYNLRNNGWPASFSCIPNIQGDGVPSDQDPVAYTNTTLSFYPSLADIIHFSKASAVVDPQNLDTYSPWALSKFIFGNTKAPQGHYVLNAFNRDRTAASSIPGLYDSARDLDNVRPVSIEFYAGRVFYLKPNGELLFSQLFSDISKADKCHQEADPTAEEINDLVATDGGVIRIRDVGEAKKIIATGNALILLASNGVWSISGTDAQGFSASNFESKKLTNEGVESSESAILVEDTVMYWGESGVYGTVPDEVTGQPTIRNITENVIQTKYLTINKNGKKFAKGHYDSENRKVYWAYDPDSDGTNWRYRYSNILVLDTVLGAWYEYTLPAGRLSDGTPTHISSMVQAEEIGVDVTGESDERLDEVATKFLVVDETSTDTFDYAWAEFKDLGFQDFSTSSDGTDFSSVVETGTDIVDSPMTQKYGNYLYCFFERTETSADDGTVGPHNQSSCKFRAKWNWADSEASNKWSELQQAYRFKRTPILDINESGNYDFDYGHEVIETKNKLRGNGRSLSIRFESESGKDFKLLGWGMPIISVTGI